jgi:hypothetical protein
VGAGDHARREVGVAEPGLDEAVHVVGPTRDARGQLGDPDRAGASAARNIMLMSASGQGNHRDAAIHLTQ